MSKKMELADIPEMNFGRWMLDRMKQFGDKVALVDGFTEKSYTYNDVVYRSERLAAGLQGIGVAKGDVICIMSPNHLDYGIVAYGVALATGVLQPINPLYTKDDVARVFTEAETKVIITTSIFVSKVKDVVASDTKYAHIKIILIDDVETDGCMLFKSLLDPEHGDYVTPECDPKTTTLYLLSSSGTTGVPKMVMLSHYSTVANTLQIHWVEAFADNSICFVPMFHSYGICIMLATSHYSGFTLIVMPKFNPETYLKLIQTHKSTFLHTVPPVMVMLAKHPKVSEYDLSSVTSIVCGAAPLSEEIETVVKNRLNVEHITQGYGMTETGVTHANTNTEFKRKSVGKLLPQAGVKIVDVDTGKDTGKALGVGDKGEIWLRGPQVALGYFNQPDQTKDMFLDDGWVRTGDIGYEDEEGFLFVVDRLKELIKYKGYQVAPATLEDILLRHDAVADVGVIGIPNEEAGELPRAFVVKKAGHDVTESELQEFVAGLVAPHLKLRGGAEFVTDIPRNLSGKILRRVLRARLSKQE